LNVCTQAEAKAPPAQLRAARVAVDLVLAAVRDEELWILVFILVTQANIAIELQLLDRFGELEFR